MNKTMYNIINKRYRENYKKKDFFFILCYHQIISRRNDPITHRNDRNGRSHSDRNRNRIRDRNHNLET